MNSEKKLNEIISDIYSDLEKLQSARDQVKIVTDNSMKLTEATSIYIKKLDELSSKFGKENSKLISRLNQNINDYEKQIINISEKGNEFTDIIGEKIQEFEKSTQDIKKNAGKVIEELKKVAISIIEAQEKNISNTLNSIEKTNSEIYTLVTTITEYDIPKRLKTIYSILVSIGIGIGIIILILLLINHLK